MRKVWKELLSGCHHHEVKTAAEPRNFLRTVPPNIVVKKQEKEEKIREMNASVDAVDPQRKTFMSLTENWWQH